MAEKIEELSTEQVVRVKFLDLKPSDEGLLKVLEQHPNWETYAISLGLKIEQVDYFYRMKRGDNGVLALRHWRDGHCGEDYPGTWRAFLKVMKDSKHLGPVLASKLEQKISDHSKWTLLDPVSPTECDCFTGMTILPPVNHGIKKFNNSIDKLKEFYNRDSIIQDNLLEMSPQLRYIPLSYVKVGENKERTEASKPESVQYEDIISLAAQASKGILIQGYPGSGKTTTLRKICHDFADRKLPPAIKVVIRVVLGELQEGPKLRMEDLMQTCISEEHSDVVDEIASFARDHNGEGILFLIDGFDELPRELQKKSLVASILNGEAYPKSSYIITSRPSAKAQLPPQAVQQMDHIETQGFTEEMVEQFILLWFLTRLEIGMKLLEIIFKNSNLRHMCCNPLTVLIACTIGNEEQMLPETITELLKSFMCILGNHYLKKNGKEPSILHWEDLVVQCSSFKQLAELALHGFHNGQYTFTDQDASLPHRPSELNHMGLFAVTSQRKKGVSVKSYRFFHRIIHEFLAAYALFLKPSTTFWNKFLAQCSAGNTGKLQEYQERSNRQPRFIDTHFETLLQLYAGLTNLRDASIQQLLFDMVDTDQGIELDNFSIVTQLCCILYESQNEEFTGQLLSRYKPSLRIDCDCLRLHEYEWCLQNVSFSLLNYNRLFETRKSLELVRQVCVTNKERLEEFHCEAEVFFLRNEHTSIFPLDILAVCSKLKVLVFHGDRHNQFAFTSRGIINFLNKVASLQTLSLERIQLSDMDVETVVGDISRSVKQLKNLSNVRLKDCCDELTRGVVEGLWRRHNPQHQLSFSQGCGLWDLVINAPLESDDSFLVEVSSGDGTMCHTKDLTPDFTRQELCFTGKKDIHISQQSLVKFLNKFTSLQTLSLERVQLSDMDEETVVGDISRGVKQLKNLSEVTLEYCCDELTRGVVEGLWRRHNPQHLLSSSQGHQLWDLIMDTLSESDDTLSLQVSSDDGTICHIKDVSQNFTWQQLYVKGLVNKKMCISQQSLVKFINTFTSLQTLSLKGVQLSDMDVETVVGDISRSVKQLKNLSNVRLNDCCDELTRGVVEGLWRRHNPQHQLSFSQGGQFWDLVMDTLSESDGSLSLEVSDGYGTIDLTMQSLVVKGQHSFVQGRKEKEKHISKQSLVKFLNKFTSLHTLSLERVQLSDVDVETVGGDIGRGVMQLNTLSNVTLEDCCDELTRGVVEGLWRRYNPQHQLSYTQSGRLWDLVMDTLSEFDDSSSLKISTGDGSIDWDTVPDWGSLFLNVRGKEEDIHISQQSLVKFVNKSTSLYTLSLKRVQLSDVDVETVVGDISRGVKQLESLFDVSLKDCCDELTKGVIEGLWRRHNPQHQWSSSQGCGLWDLVINALSECDDSLSLQVSSGDGTIYHTTDVSPDFARQELYVAVLGEKEDIHVSQQSLVKFRNKSTIPLTLSMKRVQLSDVDEETVVGNISRCIQQLKNLAEVRLEYCCDELTRGVVEGLWRRHNPQHQLPSSQGGRLWDLVMDTLSESNDSLLLNVSSGDGTISLTKLELPDGRGLWSCWGRNTVETFLDVLGKEKDIHISQQSLVKFLNKFTSLHYLTLERVQLSDMDVETVVGDISRGVKQLKNLQSVKLEDCCDELTRGMIAGIRRRLHIERFTLVCKNVICSEKVLKSLENIRKSNHLKNLSINLGEVSPYYMASIVCGCFQSTTIERLHFIADHVKDTADGVGEELLRRLESAIRDNSTMRELMLDDLILFSSCSTPIVPASVAGAILKGAAHNKGLESMSMCVPNDLHELVDAVKQENKKLRLDVEYCKKPSEIEESTRDTSNMDSEDDYETADEGSM